MLATSVLLLTNRMQNSSTTMMKSRLCSGSGIGIHASSPRSGRSPGQCGIAHLPAIEPAFVEAVPDQKGEDEAARAEQQQAPSQTPRRVPVQDRAANS